MTGANDMASEEVNEERDEKKIAIHMHVINKRAIYT
jgi:hypothetical protein